MPGPVVFAFGPAEGTLVLAYHDRWAGTPSGGVYLACSYDGGTTWGEPMWISGGAYPCIIALDDGSLLCSYYQTNSLLRATVFKVPFPSGLVTENSPAGLLVKWDTYSGEKAGVYRYRVYRAEEAPVQAGPDGLLGKWAGRFVDETAEPVRSTITGWWPWRARRRSGAPGRRWGEACKMGGRPPGPGARAHRRPASATLTGAWSANSHACRFSVPRRVPLHRHQ